MTIARLFAVLLIVLPGAVQAQSVGRLFFTPDQRAVLENLKGRPPVAVTQISETITVNGLVQRSDGKSIVWINGVPQTEAGAATGVELRGRPASAVAVPIVVPSTGRTFSLKVGETVDVAAGTPRQASGPTPPPAPGSEKRE